MVDIAIALAFRVANLSACRFLVIEAYKEHAKKYRKISMDFVLLIKGNEKGVQSDQQVKKKYLI